MCEENGNVVSRFFLEVIGQGKVEVINDLLKVCYVEHRQGSTFDSNLGIKAEMQAIRDAFPNRIVVVDEMAFADDLVWCRWSLSAQHLRPILGYEATGATFETTGVDVFRVHNGRIAERWTHEGCLGLLPELESASAMQAGRAEDRQYQFAS
jgi:predicted SnoaL-like aldol condensation-catalyzing enzyme